MDVLGHQPVGAHHDVRPAVLQLLDHGFLLLGGAEAGQQLDRHGEVPHAVEEGLVVLPGQDGGGAENGALLAVHDALEGGPEGHFRFSKAHVAAEQPLHGDGLFHIRLDLGDAAELVVGLLVVEVGFKVPLVLGVRGEGVAFHLHPLGVEGDELVGHFVHGLFHPGAGLLPLAGVEAVQLDLGVLPGPDILADQVQLGHGDVEGVGPGVLDFDIVLDNAVKVQLVDAGENADAVGDVDHVIPLGQVGKGLDLLALPLFGLGGGDGHGLAGGGQGELDGGVLEPGGKGPGQDQDLPVLDGFQVLDVGGGEAHSGQVVGQVGGGLGGPGQDGAAVALLQQGGQVALEELQVPVPAGGLEGADVDDVLDAGAGARPGEGVQQNHPVALDLSLGLLGAQRGSCPGPCRAGPRRKGPSGPRCTARKGPWAASRASVRSLKNKGALSK